MHTRRCRLSQREFNNKRAPPLSRSGSLLMLTLPFLPILFCVCAGATRNSHANYPKLLDNRHKSSPLGALELCKRSILLSKIMPLINPQLGPHSGGRLNEKRPDKMLDFYMPSSFPKRAVLPPHLTSILSL